MAVGTSQSMVARVWRRHLSASRLSGGLPAAIVITRVLAGAGACVIQATVIDSAAVVLVPETMRSTRRIPLQTVLATPLANVGSLPTGVSVDAGSLVLSTGYLAPNMAGTEDHIILDTFAWQGLLHYLVTATYRMAAADLSDLQRSVVEWVARGSGNLDWRPPEREAAHAITTQPTQSVLDQVFELIVARVRDGTLSAGDPVTESSLARTLHTTRNQTREALRALAATGLLDNRGVRGVTVPRPTRADVQDAYAARRALGSEILKRAVANPNLDFSRIDTALAQVTATARTRDSYATGEADLRFQDVLAQASGMRTLPQMMGTLARQLRIYIAVLGLGYVYPIDEMVADDTELVRCLYTRDTTAALMAWNRKIDATLEFMTAHVTRAR